MSTFVWGNALAVDVCLAAGQLEKALEHADQRIDQNDVIKQSAIRGPVNLFWPTSICFLDHFVRRRARVLAAIAVRDKDAAKLKAAEAELESLRTQMLGWCSDNYVGAVIAKELQMIFKATGREAEGRARLEEAASKLEMKEESGFKDWLLGDRII